MKKLLKNKFFILLTVISAIVLLISVILRLLTPYSPDSLTDYINDDSHQLNASFTTFNFEPANIAVPTQLYFYEGSIESNFLYYLNELKNTQQLVQHEAIDYLFVGPTYSVNALVEENKLSLSLTEPLTEYIPSPLNEVTVKQNALKIMKETFPTIAFTAVENQITYFNWDVDLYTPVTLQEAEIATIPFSLNLQGYPVLIDKDFDYPATVTLTNEHVTKIDINPILIKTTQSFQKNAISLTDAENKIKNGEYVVISYGDLSQDVKLTEFNSVTLSLNSIEYRYIPESQQIIPFYVFEGLASNQANSTPLKIITPAI